MPVHLVVESPDLVLGLLDLFKQAHFLAGLIFHLHTSIDGRQSVMGFDFELFQSETDCLKGTSFVTNHAPYCRS